MLRVNINLTRNEAELTSWLSTYFNGAVSDALWFFVDRETKGKEKVLNIGIVEEKP